MHVGDMKWKEHLLFWGRSQTPTNKLFAACILVFFWSYDALLVVGQHTRFLSFAKVHENSNRNNNQRRERQTHSAWTGRYAVSFLHTCTSTDENQPNCDRPRAAYPPARKPFGCIQHAHRSTKISKYLVFETLVVILPDCVPSYELTETRAAPGARQGRFPPSHPRRGQSF